MTLESVKPRKIKVQKLGMLERLLSMVTFSIRERMLSSKLFLILYLLYTISVIVGISILAFLIDLTRFIPISDRADALGVYFIFMLFAFSLSLLNDLSFWLIVFSGSGFISEEISSSVMLLYYSKPVPKYYYPLSRFIAMFSIIFLVAVIPIIIMSTVPFARNNLLLSYFNLWEITYYVLASITTSILVLTFYILFAFAVSSIVKDRGASVLISFITYYSSFLMGTTLSAYVDRSFIVISIPFWATSTFFVILGIPWKKVNWGLFENFFPFLLIGGLKLDPLLYVIGFMNMIITIMVASAIFYLNTKKIDLGGVK